MGTALQSWSFLEARGPVLPRVGPSGHGIPGGGGGSSCAAKGSSLEKRAAEGRVGGAPTAPTCVVQEGTSVFTSGPVLTGVFFH